MNKFLLAVVVAILPLTDVAAADSTALFKSKCAMCHGPDGSGATPMGKKLALKALGAPEVQTSSDAKLVEVIAKGKDKMPAFAKKLSDEQIRSLVAVVRGFAKK
jgi:cytochrome c6